MSNTSSNTSSKPFSIRFPAAVTEVINNLSQSQGQTPSDVIREAVEFGLAGRDDFRNRIARYTADPKRTVQAVLDKIESAQARAREKQQFKNGLGQALPGSVPLFGDDEISSQEIAALMIFWQLAYSHIKTSQNVNPVYVVELLDITGELLAMARANKVHLDFAFLMSRMDSEFDLALIDSVDFVAEIERIKTKFIECPTAGYAETLMRPLSIMSDSLLQIAKNKSSLQLVFSHERIYKLLPVLVHYVGALHVTFEAPGRERDSSGTFTAGELSMSLNEDLSLLVSDKHSAYIFKPASVVDLVSMIEQRIDEQSQFEFSTGSVEVSRFSRVMLHEHGAYRLLLGEAEFAELVSNLRAITQTSKWMNKVKQHRLSKGDI